MILDTDALSAFVDGDARPSARCCASQSRAAIPVIVLGEFRYGIAESRHRSAYEAWLGSHLPQFDVLPVTDGHRRRVRRVAGGAQTSGAVRFRPTTPGLRRSRWSMGSPY